MLSHPGAPRPLTVLGQLTADQVAITAAHYIKAGHTPTNHAFKAAADRAARVFCKHYDADRGADSVAASRDCTRIRLMYQFTRCDLTPADALRLIFPRDFE